MPYVLKSLVNILVDTGKELDAHRKFVDIASFVHISCFHNDDVLLKRSFLSKTLFPVLKVNYYLSYICALAL